jgi:hypothetical protein
MPEGNLPQVVSRCEWLALRKELLARKKDRHA